MHSTGREGIALARHTQTDPGVARLERKYRRLAWQARRRKWLRRLPLIAAGLLLTAAVCIIAAAAARGRSALPADGALTVYLLDVGQGDAVLVTQQEHALLIDGGEADQGLHVVQLLSDAGVRSLDCVINSHPHSDHMGGLQAVLERVPVGALYFPDIPVALLPTTESYRRLLETAAEKQIPVRIPKCGDTLTLGGAALTFLSVDNTAFAGLNNCSLGVRLEYGGFSFFAAGDLEQPGEQAMLAAGLISPVTLLKVSHHGSSTSTSPEFLAAARPKLACISVGADNDYGHPTRKTLNALIEAGCQVFRTDSEGTVILRTDGNSVERVILPQ